MRIFVNNSTVTKKDYRIIKKQSMVAIAEVGSNDPAFSGLLLLGAWFLFYF